MSKSNWLQRVTPLALAISIGALFVVAVYERLDQSEYYPGQEQTTDRYAERAQDRISVECAGLDVAASAKCENEIIQTAEENRTAQQDLQQQTKMATWALWMMVSSFFSVGVTAIGVIYVARTLDQTVAANKAAITAATAALDANEIMRGEQRPWVAITAPEGLGYFGPPSPDFKSRLTCKVEFQMENVGKRPAFNVGGKIRAFQHNSTKELVEYAKSSVVGRRVTPEHYRTAALFPSEVFRPEPEFRTYYLELGNSARYTSIVVSVIYSLDDRDERRGGYVRCFTLEGTSNPGYEVASGQVFEEFEARVVL